jgi:PAS domain S-box-containing protein/diguanylate cyclase (GGDEF)-like protein
MLKNDAGELPDRKTEPDAGGGASWLGRVSISTKLVVMVSGMAAVSLLLLLITILSLNIAAGVRAYVGGEGLYSKGQKDAVYYLMRYARLSDERDYEKYLQAVAVPLGDHAARVELQKTDYDYAAAARGFIRGGNAESDIPYLVLMFRVFHRIGYFAHAIDLWTAADAWIAELVQNGSELRHVIQAGGPDKAKIADILERIEQINAAATPLEREFSATLGEAARWIKSVLIETILLFAAILLAAGVWLSWRIAREIQLGIGNLRTAAVRVKRGDLDHRVSIASSDELGDLAIVFNEMIENRKSAEDALRSATEFRVSIMQRVTNAIFVLDLEGRFVVVNQRTCEITGYSESELIGKLYGELIPEDHRERLWQVFTQLLRGGPPVSNNETPLIRKDGSIVTLAFSSASLPREQKIIGVVGAAEDITRRKQAEATLEQERVFLKALLENLSEGIVACDDRGILSIFNRATREFHGLPEEPLPPEEWADRYDLFLADGRTRMPVERIPLFRAWRGEVVKEVEIVVAPRNRPRRSLMCNGQIIVTAAGERLGAVVAMYDITEHKKATDELAARAAELTRLNRIHAVLSSVSSMIVRVHDRQELLQEACRIAVEYGGFLAAFVGEIATGRQDGRPIAWAGVDDGYADTIRLTLRADSPYRDRPGNRALRGKTKAICNDIATDASVADLHENALARGFRSMAAFPLLVDGAANTVLVLFSGEAGFFNLEEVKLLEELTGDISLALGAITKENKLQFLINFDPLTGLANRNLFKDRIGQKMLDAERDKSGFALIVFEIERFDALSHSLGQSATDKLIVEVARRLRARLGEQTDLARVTHKAFSATMFLDSDTAQVVVDWIEQQLFGVFDTPFSIEDQDLRFAGRAGVALCPADGLGAEGLLHNAESALERARESSERISFYAPAMNLRLAQRLKMETKLRRAIERQEFVVHYQPKIDMGQGGIVGVEALLRWNDPDSGLVPPGEFIPFLEETGLILEVSRWLLRKVAEDLSGPLAQDGHPPRVAVNISPLHLQHKDFLADIQLSIRRGGKFGDRLDLEITESMLMQDVEISIEKLLVVRSVGLEIAIDDFGTGYSSLAYLSRLPVTAVKIDQNFIARMQTEEHVMNLVSTIVSLAHSLKLKVIAEGVETAQQLETLQHLKCDEYQGFVYSPAVPIERLLAILRGQMPVTRGSTQ